MNINVDELILTGKVSRDVKVGDFVFTLATPSAEVTATLDDPMSILSAYITKIVDVKNNVSDDTASSESKQGVVDLLKKCQGGVIIKLSEAIGEMGSEQKEIFDSLKK